ncbi:MAG: fused MFS/spermidine synthase [Acidobacteriia bacterium]|nr:fused MFS/spermidine synthase [Terriglobia bacterium]
MAWFFWFFFVSGFCSVLCELIWLRLSMAQFGVTTALTSIVLSVFMAGLGAGSWIAGTLVRRYRDRISFPPLRLYAVLELMIGLSALVVPAELVWGHHLLEVLADRAAVSSAAYYLISGLWLSATMIPFCACMGATIPVAMFAIRQRQQEGDGRSFSFLYLANVLGAVLGSFLPLLLIEPYGFHRTLRIGAALNVAIAVSAFAVSLRSRPVQPRAAGPSEAAYSPTDSSRSVLVLLFTTGLATMGMELIWIRLFTPYVGPVVYSFGMILVAYLLATFMGSRIYRNWSRTRKQESRLTWISLALLGILPLLTADARVPLHLVARVFLGVMPFAAMMGFLTPMLVDRWSGGDPDRAGRAYAVNVVGCIIGPLVCGFLLLPLVGEHWSVLLLCLPWFAMAFPSPHAPGFRPFSRVAAYGILLLALSVLLATKDFETQFPGRRVRRDATATVVAYGDGMKRRLLVNGMGMTALTPITKMMAHMTLASLDHTPRSALIICFGMGTTFRSVVTWNISGTAVELVPSVPQVFSFFHADAAEVMASPFAHVVIDDGRRYLERSPAKYDAIIVDPPPPVQTAGSSLLYSQDFYTIARQRLQPGGILQQWLPEADDPTQAAVARAIKSSFPYVRVFRGMEGWGWHFLASERPIPTRTAAELVARMPSGAVTDMMEWGPAASPEQQVDLLLDHETSTDAIIALSPATATLTDDRPINEYFLLRTPFGELMAME